jgi:DNA-binding NtrC family response regulator
MRDLPLILICDDDPGIIKSLQLSLKSGFEIHTSTTVAQAKIMAKAHEYDAAIIDLNFEGQELDGINLLDYFGKVSPGTYLIVLSGDPSVRRAIEATRRKLFQFIHKDGDYFADLYSSLNRATQLKKAKEEQIIQKYMTNSPAIKDILKKIERIIQNNQGASILILGETGTGKDFLVKHIASNMKKKLVICNMASFEKDTAESRLFGHVRGAFTGADQDKVGMMEAANNGIFFLDEVGETSLEVQAKLLRGVDQKEVQPLGSNTTRSINVIFIAATNKKLKQMVADGTFREDFWQRLSTFPLRIPSLRERPEDIIFYANYYLEECGDESISYTISNDGIQELLAYSWPGNIRELKSIIQRFIVFSNKTVLDAKEVKTALAMNEDSPLSTVTTSDSKIVTIENNIKKDELIKAIAACNGNKTQAAAELGMKIRTLHRWVKKFNIEPLFSTTIPSKP